MTAPIMLVACAPSGDAAIVERNGQLWLYQYPKPRPSDRRELATALAEGFVRLDEQLDSSQQLAARMDEMRRQWLATLPAPESFLAEYTPADVRRMFHALERSVAQGRSEAQTLGGFALRMLKDCPAVLLDAELHRTLLSVLDGSLRPLDLAFPGDDDIDPAVQQRVTMQLAA